MITRLRRQRTGRPDATGQPAAAGSARVRIAPREGSSGGRPSRRPRLGLRPLPLAGLILIVVGLLVVLGYGAAAGQRASVLVAARALPAGTLLTASDLRSSGIGADGSLLAALVPTREQARVLGRRLGAPIGAGEPLTRSQLAALSVAPAAFTISVLAEHALGGQLEAGDRVSVLATFTTPSGAVTTRALARGLLVLAVGQLPRLGDPSQTTIPVTVALPAPALASRLALANSVAKIDLLRDSPAESATAIPAAVAPGSAP